MPRETSPQSDTSISQPRRSSRRPRSPSSEQEPVPARKKRRSTDNLIRVGKHIARTSCIKFPVYDFIERGVLALMELDEGANISDLPYGNMAEIAFMNILRMVPDARKTLLDPEESEAYMRVLASKIEDGMSQARADDASSLKTAVLSFFERLEPSIPPRAKSMRGFYHDQIGGLLCPPHLDWDDSVVKQELRDGMVTPKVGQIPRFAYKDFYIDPENVMDGIFQSELLLQAAVHIFISPSAAADSSARSTRRGNAALNKMKQVSISTIAYVTTQVRFALSSDEVFGKNARFEIYKFYKYVWELLANEEIEDDVDSILKVWNKRLFSGILEGAADSDDASNYDTLGLILSQRSSRSRTGDSRGSGLAEQDEE